MTLYFVHVLTTDGRKEAATEAADAARFLVHDAAARFDWTSVLPTGTVEAVPEEEREAVEAEVDLSWRPDAFERVSGSRNTRLYEFEITERAGLRHDGLPPGYEPRV